MKPFTPTVMLAGLLFALPAAAAESSPLSAEQCQKNVEATIKQLEGAAKPNGGEAKVNDMSAKDIKEMQKTMLPCDLAKMIAQPGK